MRKMNLFIIMATAILLLFGCRSGADSTTLDNSGATNGDAGTEQNGNDTVPDGTEISQTAMSDYFLPDGSKAHFQGEGNEFAELDVEVNRPFDTYVINYENNGGALIRHIYKIEPDAITILDERMVDTKQDFPSLDELDAMEPTGIYLKMPFEKGTTFDQWTIVETDATVETPFKTFDHAIVIEMLDEDFINRKYFVEGFGEVKREAIMQMEGEEDFIVTSTLKAVDE